LTAERPHPERPCRITGSLPIFAGRDGFVFLENAYFFLVNAGMAAQYGDPKISAVVMACLSSMVLGVHGPAGNRRKTLQCPREQEHWRISYLIAGRLYVRDASKSTLEDSKNESQALALTHSNSAARRCELVRRLSATLSWSAAMAWLASLIASS